MDSPRVGIVRDSMLINPLHIKARLGKSKFRGLSGPGPDFTYGTSSGLATDGGVAEALSDWQQQARPRGDSASSRPAGAPDFVSLNRDAVKAGLVTSQEISQFRALSQSARGSSRGTGPAPKHRQGGGASRRPPVPDITFGVTTRASSPLCDLLSHQYAHRWLQEQLSKSQTHTQGTMNRIRPGCIPDTRTTLLRRSQPLPLERTPFKLPAYTQVAAAVDTFRNPDDRARATANRRGACSL